MRRHAHQIALVLAVGIAAMAYVGFERLNTEPPTFITVRYTEALVAGHSDLQGMADPAARLSATDASVYHHRYFLYFGIVPFITVLAPVLAATGHQLTEAPLILGYSLGAVAGLSWLLSHLARACFPRAGPLTLMLAVLVAALGGGSLLLSRSTTTYELMIAAAWFHGVFMLCCAAAALQPHRRARFWLALTGLNAGLVVGCRPDQVGVAVAAGLFILFRAWPAPDRATRLRNLLWVLAPLAGVAAGLMGYNWLRFDNPLEFGFRYQLSMAAQVSRGILSLRYVPINLWHYLIGWPGWSGWFPYFGWPASPPLAVPPGYYRVDQAYGALVTLPVAVVAICLIGRRFRTSSPGSLLSLTCACGLQNLLLLSCFDCAVYRYTADFLPYVAIAAGWGMLALGHRARRWLAGASALLALFSLGASFCETVALYDMTEVHNPVFFGRLRRMADFPRMEWERLRRTPLPETRVRLLLPPDKFGTDEPLLVTGHEGLQDFFYFYYVAPGQLRIGYELMGRGGALSDYLPVDYRQPITVELILGNRWPPAGAWNYGSRSPAEVARLRETLVIKVNGKAVLRAQVPFHPEKGLVYWGRSPNDPAFGAVFSGRLLKVSQVPASEPLPP